MNLQEQYNQQEILTLYSERIKSLCKKALLIEDNHLILYLHNRYLTELGFTVEIANTLESALQHASHQCYDLIVTDLGLPDSSNEPIITHLRNPPSLNLKTTLIVVTATDSQPLKSRCLKAGADEFMVKPLKKTELEKILPKLFNDNRIFSRQQSEKTK